MLEWAPLHAHHCMLEAPNLTQPRQACLNRSHVCTVDSASSFSSTWMSLRAFGRGTADPLTLFRIALGCGTLRLSCGKLRSRLRVANCPQNAKTRQTCAGLLGFHQTRICCPNSTARAISCPTPCYAEEVGPGSTTHTLQSI